MRARASWFAALAAAVVLSGGAMGCGDSPEDTAHSDGKAVGQALAQLGDAKSVQELTSATVALRQAVDDVSDDVGSRARTQLQAQRATLEATVAELRTAITAENATTRDQARNNVQIRVQDLRSNAASFADSDDSVANSFWDGVKDGYDG